MGSYFSGQSPLVLLRLPGVILLQWEVEELLRLPGVILLQWEVED
jgi:hypothetical protein